MGVPYHGEYTSEDGVQKVVISSTNSSNGAISGSYKTTSSPVGELSIDTMTGLYMWVNNKEQGRDGVAPFVITFTAAQRPSGRPYTIIESWEGGYKTDDSMLLTGTRSYVTEDGDVQSLCLGTKVFRM